MTNTIYETVITLGPWNIWIWSLYWSKINRHGKVGLVRHSYLTSQLTVKDNKKWGDLSLTSGVFGLTRKFERVNLKWFERKVKLFKLEYVRVDLWEKFIEICNWCDIVKIF